MSFLGWRYGMHMLFLRSGSRGLTHIKGINGGEAGCRRFRSAKDKREKLRVQNYFNRRGEGGEGRVRMQSRKQRFCVSFVHVFNGYVASLSATIIK